MINKIPSQIKNKLLLFLIYIELIEKNIPQTIEILKFIYFIYK